MTFRIEAEEDRLKLWPQDDEDQAELYKLAQHLKSWGFAPDYHGPRGATEQELAGVAGMAGVAEFARNKGIIWYEWPITLRRSNEDAGGRGFDDLREELVRRGNEISSMELSEILKHVRWRNIPLGKSGRDYM